MASGVFPSTLPPVILTAVRGQVGDGRDRRAGHGRPARGSAVAVDDPPAVQIVGRQLDLDPVAGQDADPVAPHPARDVTGGLMAVVELDPEEAVAERLGDLALHLDLFFLDAHMAPLSPPG